MNKLNRFYKSKNIKYLKVRTLLMFFISLIIFTVAIILYRKIPIEKDFHKNINNFPIDNYINAKFDNSLTTNCDGERYALFLQDEDLDDKIVTVFKINKIKIIKASQLFKKGLNNLNNSEIISEFKKKLNLSIQ